MWVSGAGLEDLGAGLEDLGAGLEDLVGGAGGPGGCGWRTYGCQ